MSDPVEVKNKVLEALYPDMDASTIELIEGRQIGKHLKQYTFNIVDENYHPRQRREFHKTLREISTSLGKRERIMYKHGRTLRDALEFDMIVELDNEE